MRDNRYDTYQYNVRVGDIVRMPNGVIATVSDFDIMYGGHILEVTVSPLIGWLGRTLLKLCGKTKYHDEEVNGLELLKRE